MAKLHLFNLHCPPKKYMNNTSSVGFQTHASRYFCCSPSVTFKAHCDPTTRLEAHPSLHREREESEQVAFNRNNTGSSNGNSLRFFYGFQIFEKNSETLSASGVSYCHRHCKANWSHILERGQTPLLKCPSSLAKPKRKGRQLSVLCVQDLLWSHARQPQCVWWRIFRLW